MKKKNTFERGVNAIVLIVALFCGIATIGAICHSVPWHWICLGSLAYLFISKANQRLGAMTTKAEMEQPTIPVPEEKQEEKKPAKPRANIDLPVP